jgi:hypothetical protein
MYVLNETKSHRLRLTDDLAWVTDVGVNTTDIELYGEKFAGYVWATVSRFSLYGIAASTFNRPPDTSTAYPSTGALWPPNHKFRDVHIQGCTDPDGDVVSITITRITSDEPTNGKHSPDAQGVGTDTASLRAERLGTGNGRVYVITFLASDGNGGEATGNVTACVPHHKTCVYVDDGQHYDATQADMQPGKPTDDDEEKCNSRIREKSRRRRDSRSQR